MTSVTSAAPAFKDAFVEGVTTLFAAQPSVYVNFGHPGMNQPDQMVNFNELSSELVPATLGTRRQMEETITITIVASVWIGGAASSEKPASDRAFALMGDVEFWCRVTDTTVGGTVRECFLTSLSYEGTPPEFLATGRLAEVTGTFTAHARVSS